MKNFTASQAKMKETTKPRARMAKRSRVSRWIAVFQFENRGDDHDRHGGEKGVFGGGFSLQAGNHSAEDRRSRSRHARPKRKALKKPDGQGFFPGDRIDAFFFLRRQEVFDQEDRHGPNGQRGGDRERRKQMFLDVIDACDKPSKPAGIEVMASNVRPSNAGKSLSFRGNSSSPRNRRG